MQWLVNQNYIGCHQTSADALQLNYQVNSLFAEQGDFCANWRKTAWGVLESNNAQAGSRPLNSPGSAVVWCEDLGLRQIEDWRPEDRRSLALCVQVTAERADLVTLTPRFSFPQGMA